MHSRCRFEPSRDVCLDEQLPFYFELPNRITRLKSDEVVMGARSRSLQMAACGFLIYIPSRMHLRCPCDTAVANAHEGGVGPRRRGAVS